MEKKKNGENRGRDQRKYSLSSTARDENTFKTVHPNTDSGFIPIIDLVEDIEIVNEFHGKNCAEKLSKSEEKLKEDVKYEVKNEKESTLHKLAEDRFVFKKTNDSVSHTSVRKKMEARKTVQESRKASQIISTLKSKGIKVEKISTCLVSKVSTPNLSVNQDEVQIIAPETNNTKPDIIKSLISSASSYNEDDVKIITPDSDDTKHGIIDSEIDLKDCFTLSILDGKGFIKEEIVDHSFEDKPQITAVYSLSDGSNRANWQSVEPAPSSNDDVLIEDILEISNDAASYQDDLFDSVINLQKKRCLTQSTQTTDRDISPEPAQTSKKSSSQLTTRNEYFLRKRPSRPIKKAAENEVEKLYAKYAKKTISTITTMTTKINKKIDKLQTAVKASSCNSSATTSNAAQRAKRGSRNIPRLRQFPMLDMNSSYLHVLNRICEDVQQEMGPKLKENEIEWTVNAEVLFFYSLIGHKPVGVNRHFMMLLIHNKFSVYLNHQISSKVLWDHLDSMYDMAALHESEIIPFPNEEVDFELPEDCHELLRTKHGVSLKKSDSDNELNKGNANNVKASKKIAPKIKQSNTPVSTPKTTFATPVASKPLKTQTVVKTEIKAPTSDATPKVSRSESGSSSKTNKIKRSSSPFATKLVKTESASVVKEDSPDIPSSKKIKSDRSSSPAVVKKPVKTESSVTANSAKKLVKSESSGNVSKTSKSETSDNSVKKVKVDKDQVSKKGKTATPADMSTKKVKSDANGTKKRSESESSSKKSSDSSSARQMKTEVKSSSQSSKETETSTPSGSRKSSPVVKAKNSDSSKKLKRHKLEESSKKSTSTPKRRRP